MLENRPRRRKELGGEAGGISDRGVGRIARAILPSGTRTRGETAIPHSWRAIESRHHGRVSSTFELDTARARLLGLVRELAYRSGVDIVLASGKRSDFYINGKRISLHPEGLWLMSRLLLAELATLPEITAIGGLTLGADPIAAGVSALSWETGQNLDAFLVRKEAKGHGTGSRIEGTLAEGQKVAVIEDTITTGGSARKAIDAVREVGADPVVVLALADRMDPEGDAFRKEFDVRPLFSIEEIRGDD